MKTSKKNVRSICCHGNNTISNLTKSSKKHVRNIRCHGNTKLPAQASVTMETGNNHASSNKSLPLSSSASPDLRPATSSALPWVSSPHSTGTWEKSHRNSANNVRLQFTVRRNSKNCLTDMRPTDSYILVPFGSVDISWSVSWAFLSEPFRPSICSMAIFSSCFVSLTFIWCSANAYDTIERKQRQRTGARHATWTRWFTLVSSGSAIIISNCACALLNLTTEKYSLKRRRFRAPANNERSHTKWVSH